MDNQYSSYDMDELFSFIDNFTPQNQYDELPFSNNDFPSQNQCDELPFLNNAFPSQNQCDELPFLNNDFPSQNQCDALPFLNNDFPSQNQSNELFPLTDSLTPENLLFLDEIMKETTFVSSETDEEHSDTSITDKSTQETNLICGVCSAPAYGYNFDQITCESCKAFFRRNALRQMPNLRCRYSGNCVINIHTRRHCAYCRLKKCFDIKMRKDWIRTDEELEFRQLQKLAKEQKKLNNLCSTPPYPDNVSLLSRKKRRSVTKSPNSEMTSDPIIKID